MLPLNQSIMIINIILTVIRSKIVFFLVIIRNKMHSRDIDYYFVKSYFYKNNPVLATTFLQERLAITKWTVNFNSY